MNIPFFKKKQVVVTPEPKRFEIPADNVLEIRELSDAYASKKHGTNRVGHYRLWQRVDELLPETIDMNCVIEFPSALRVEIVEKFD